MRRAARLLALRLDLARKARAADRAARAATGEHLTDVPTPLQRAAYDALHAEYAARRAYRAARRPS